MGSFDGYPNEDYNPTYSVPVKLLDDVKYAAKGNDYIMVIKLDGSLWLCGDVYLGNGQTDKAESNEGFVNVMEDVKSVFAGNDVMFVIKEDDTLWVGDNSDAQLGNGTNIGDTSTDSELTAEKILDDVAKVHEAGGKVYAIRLDGSLYGWAQMKYIL